MDSALTFSINVLSSGSGQCQKTVLLLHSAICEIERRFLKARSSSKTQNSHLKMESALTPKSVEIN